MARIRDERYVVSGPVHNLVSERGKALDRALSRDGAKIRTRCTSAYSRYWTGARDEGRYDEQSPLPQRRMREEAFAEAVRLKVMQPREYKKMVPASIRKILDAEWRKRE